jgi:hypothetical protein
LARVRNSIAALRFGGTPITPAAIMRVYTVSFEHGWEPKDMLTPERMMALARDE